jgi:hypothetical protein
MEDQLYRSKSLLIPSPRYYKGEELKQSYIDICYGDRLATKTIFLAPRHT